MRFAGYVFDLDGTIYLGDQLLPGAQDAVDKIRQAGRRAVFLTNKPLSTPEEYAGKLTRLGLPTNEADVVNSARVSARFLSRKRPGARIFVLGEAALIRELAEVGLRFAQNPEETDVVLVSLDRTLSYDKLHFAYHAAKAGAEVWATNPDLVCPMPGDEIIDAGATIAAMEALLRRPIDGVIGKPSSIMIQTVVDVLGFPASECLMVGDRLETDIAMGKKAGMTTALVLTGVTDRKLLNGSDIRPDYVLENVGGVVGL